MQLVKGKKEGAFSSIRLRKTTAVKYFQYFEVKPLVFSSTDISEQFWAAEAIRMHLNVP